MRSGTRLVAMADLDLMDVPEESYEVLRNRAELAGQTLEDYLRDQIVALASRPTKLEAIEAIEEMLAKREGPGPSVEAIVEALSESRE
jgi:antitoxin FitA